LDTLAILPDIKYFAGNISANGLKGNVVRGDPPGLEISRCYHDKGSGVRKLSAEF
jgi:hypothetical protein